MSVFIFMCWSIENSVSGLTALRGRKWGERRMGIDEVRRHDRKD